MPPFSPRMVQSSLAGAAAGLLSAGAAMAASRAGRRDAMRPLNAVSHIARGGPPPASKGRNGVNTVLGFALHLGASTFWAAVHALLFSPRPSAAHALATSAGTAGVAYLVDYHVVNERFRPGFEAHLSHRALFAVYAGFALGLAFGTLLSEKLRRS